MIRLKKRNKKKHESGQAIVEFALVLPLFLLLVMGILDFGWLFYNYISVENAARNGARIACVEYTSCSLVEAEPNSEQKIPAVFVNNTGYYLEPEKVANNSQSVSEDEADVVEAVSNSLPPAISNVRIAVSYSSDVKRAKEKPNDWMDYNIAEERAEGDVEVTVEGTIPVLTPLLGAFSGMEKTLTSTSTFHVEKQHDEYED